MESLILRFKVYSLIKGVLGSLGTAAHSAKAHHRRIRSPGLGLIGERTGSLGISNYP